MIKIRPKCPVHGLEMRKYGARLKDGILSQRFKCPSCNKTTYDYLREEIKEYKPPNGNRPISKCTLADCEIKLSKMARRRIEGEDRDTLGREEIRIRKRMYELGYKEEKSWVNETKEKINKNSETSTYYRNYPNKCNLPSS